MNLNSPSQNRIHVPSPLIWVQCITFALLYAIWMIYELLYFRRILLISGAVLALYPIYQYRKYFFQKRAAAFWFMIGLFVWVLIHLLFLAHDYPAQSMELRRIWKYAGMGAVFALGLGLSLSGVRSVKSNALQDSPYWPLIYLGLCSPVLIYLLKYALTILGPVLGIEFPAFLRINSDINSAYYIPKTDYIAFCLPVLAVSLGQIYSLLTLHPRLRMHQCLEILLYTFVIFSIIFLFYIQNTKNGIAYAIFCIIFFMALVLLKASSVKFLSKVLFLLVACLIAVTLIYPHLQKNDSWRTLIADTRVGFQLEEYPYWRYAGEKGYPNNEYGTSVSATNYERAAWLKAGIKLALEHPLGYGLVEDSFKRMVKFEWPDASPNLSHSHSGWIDLVLGLGFPGLFCILGAIFFSIRQSWSTKQPWRSMVFWALTANLMLWITTEVAATISFSALIFWVSLASGLTLVSPAQENIFEKRNDN